MDDQCGFWFGLGAFIAFTWAGCFNSDVVTTNEFERAYKFCESNNGLKEIRGFLLSQDYVCKNGAILTVKSVDF